VLIVLLSLQTSVLFTCGKPIFFSPAWQKINSRPPRLLLILALLRYGELFGKWPARCRDNNQPCDGKSPKNCQRFVGAIIENQSAHDWICNRNMCTRVFWDEDSYRSIPGIPGVGARAVCIRSTDKSNFKYREASNKTLAISHVWSHGQGGRPEHILDNPDPGGMNSCLHDRYVSLARDFGCDSYWMDTPCIPESHDLRAESISKINSVFYHSRATLICDRDLADIDITNMTISLRESILATVCVFRLPEMF
jgi:hypothetical protein